MKSITSSMDVPQQPNSAERTSFWLFGGDGGCRDCFGRGVAFLAVALLVTFNWFYFYGYDQFPRSVAGKHLTIHDNKIQEGGASPASLARQPDTDKTGKSDDDDDDGDGDDVATTKTTEAADSISSPTADEEFKSKEGYIHFSRAEYESHPPVVLEEFKLIFYETPKACLQASSPGPLLLRGNSTRLQFAFPSWFLTANPFCCFHLCPPMNPQNTHLVRAITANNNTIRSLQRPSGCCCSPPWRTRRTP